MAKRQIIDAHHHLWNLGRGHNYPWLQDRPLSAGLLGDIMPIARDYLLEDFRADTGNYDLVKSVHIEAVASDPVDETRWLQGIADNDNYPHGIVARADLQSPDVEKVLAAHRQFANLRGIRHMLNFHTDPKLTFTDRNLLTDSTWLAGFKLLKKYDLSFDLQLYPAQMPAAAALAHANPHTLIILNHTGMPVERDENGMRAWREGIKLLASADNVVVKISGLGMVDWQWSEHNIRPFVLRAIETFGVDRAMFGSNFPVDKLYSSFDTLYRAFESIVSSFSTGEQDKLFRANALKYYRL